MNLRLARTLLVGHWEHSGIIVYMVSWSALLACVFLLNCYKLATGQPVIG